MALFYPFFFFQNHSYYLVQIDFLKTQIKKKDLQVFKDNSESNKKVRDKIDKMEHTFFLLFCFPTSLVSFGGSKKETLDKRGIKRRTFQKLIYTQYIKISSTSECFQYPNS